MLDSFSETASETAPGGQADSPVRIASRPEAFDCVRAISDDAGHRNGKSRGLRPAAAVGGLVGGGGGGGWLK